MLCALRPIEEKLCHSASWTKQRTEEGRGDASLQRRGEKPPCLAHLPRQNQELCCTVNAGCWVARNETDHCQIARVSWERTSQDKRKYDWTEQNFFLFSPPADWVSPLWFCAMWKWKCLTIIADHHNASQHSVQQLNAHTCRSMSESNIVWSVSVVNGNVQRCALVALREVLGGHALWEWELEI